MRIACLPPFQQAAPVASGGQPPPLPTGRPHRASLRPNPVPSAGVSAAQSPGKPPGENENILVATKSTLEIWLTYTEIKHHLEKGLYAILFNYKGSSFYHVILEDLVSL